MPRTLSAIGAARGQLVHGHARRSIVECHALRAVRERRRKTLMATLAKAPPQPVLPRMAPREDLNVFRISQIQFDMAAEYLKLDPGLRQILRTPKRVMEVSVPVKLDNGQVKVFTGFRVQHNVARGPAKGGPRHHPKGAGRGIK